MLARPFYQVRRKRFPRRLPMDRITYIIHDQFVDSNATVLSDHNPRIFPSTTWVSTADLKIYNNAVRNVVGSSFKTGVIEVGTADYLILAKIAFGANSSNVDLAYVICRYQDSANFWYVYVGEASGVAVYKIVEYVGSVPTTRAQGTIIYQELMTATLRVKVQGERITAIVSYLGYVEDITYGSAANFKTETEAGIAIYQFDTITIFTQFYSFIVKSL